MQIHSVFSRMIETNIKRIFENITCTYKDNVGVRKLGYRDRDEKLCYTAEGPRDAPCRSTSRQLLRNCMKKLHNKSRKVEVMQLEDYSRPTCNKLCASRSCALIVVGVIYKLDRRRVLLTTRRG